MNESRRQASAAPSQRCPPWCIACRDCVARCAPACTGVEPTSFACTTRRASWSRHRYGSLGHGPGTGSALIRPTWNAPTSRSAFPLRGDLQLSLSPDHARSLAAALLRAAHAADAATRNDTRR